MLTDVLLSLVVSCSKVRLPFLAHQAWPFSVDIEMSTVRAWYVSLMSWSDVWPTETENRLGIEV
jgi:hypothetical protein